MSEEKECCKCAVCGTRDCEDKLDSYHVENPTTGKYDRLCGPCAVAVWPVRIKFHFHYGIPAWVQPHMQTVAMLRQLRQWFWKGEMCHVHFVPRKATEKLEWMAEWDQYGRPRKPYSYRGWCGGNRIVVIVDSEGLETPESIEWITYHELGHHECQTVARMADAAWEAENKNDGRTGYEWEDDHAHEADSEERHVNRLATAFMAGRQYDRLWWRARVNAKQAGKEVLPDRWATEGTAERFAWEELERERTGKGIITSLMNGASGATTTVVWGGQAGVDTDRAA